jgi:acyl carrier protein
LSNLSGGVRPTKEEMAAHVQREAAKILKVPPNELQPDTRWVADLEADSLDMSELASVVEAAFGITVEDAELVPLQTVQEAYDLIWSRINEHEADLQR